MGAESSNLNLLRAVAVLAVFVAHSLTLRIDSPRLWNLGHLGVLLFFVHTSLVLMLSIQRQDRSGVDRRALRFMVRRAFRIYPLSMVAVLLYVLTKIPSGFAFGGMTTRHPSVFDTFANLALVQNLVYSDSVPVVLWSLPLEIQMYFCLPFLYILAKRFGPKFMCAVWASSVLLGLVQLNVAHLDRFGVLAYAPCFIPGVMAFAIGYRPSLKFWPLALLLPISAFMFAPKGEFLFKWLVCLSVGVAVPFFHEIKVRVLSVPAAFIAKYSFGIYLFHPAAIWLVTTGLPRLPYVIEVLIAFSITVAASVLCFYLIEQPMIGVGSALANRLRTETGARAAAAAD